MRKLMSVLLAVVLLLGVVPMWRVPAAAVAAPELEATVRKQVLAYAQSVAKSNSDEEAAVYLTKFAIRGNGATQTLGEDHHVTPCLYSSNLMQEALTKICANLIDVAQKSGRTYLYGSGSVVWRSYGNSFGCTPYYSSEKKPDESLGSMFTMKTLYNSDYAPVRNSSYDETLLWTVGESSLHVELTQTAVTADTVSYRFDVVMADRFDFDTDYSNAKGDATFEEFVSLMGTALGKFLFKEYDWSATTAFTVTVPNSCDHSSGNYHFTYNSGTQVLSTGKEDGFLPNGVTRHLYSSTNKQTGVTTSYYYHELDETIHLRHDKPWVMEYATLAPGSIAFTPLHITTTALPYILQSGRSAMYFVDYERVKLTEAEKDALGLSSTTSAYTRYYGQQFKELFKYQSKYVYKVRLENVIAADGSNMIYISFFNEDKQEQALEPTPMNNYFLKAPGDKSSSLKGESNAISGMDFCINYIGCRGAKFKADHFDLKVWENGVDSTNADAFVSKVTAPTCTMDGYTTKTCAHCGCSLKTDVVAAAGHNFSDWMRASEPDCVNPGAEYRTCGTCGHQEEREIPANGHSGGVATCRLGAVCDICFKAYGEKNPDNHAFGTEIRNQKEATEFADGYSGDVHCKGCGVLFEVGTVIPATHTHSYADAWSADGANHWHACVCGDKIEVAAHTPGTEANCHAAAACSVCGAACGEKNPDNHTGETEVRNRVEAAEFQDGYTGDVHCKGCGVLFEVGTVIPATHTHSYAEAWSADETNHWHACSCGEKAEAAAHIPGPEPTEEMGQLCTVCGWELKPVHTHTLQKVEGKDATHTEDGNVEYYVCSCGKWFADANGAELIEDHDSVRIAPYELGDVDHDHKLTSMDSMLILQYKAGLLPVDFAICEQCADVDGKMGINSMDAMLLLQYRAGLITSFR